jgi:hypothetical protein
MPVEMIIDHWKPDVKQYWTETLLLRSEEGNWVDEDETPHRRRTNNQLQLSWEGPCRRRFSRR